MSSKSKRPPTPDEQHEADEMLTAARDVFAEKLNADPQALNALLSVVLLVQGTDFLHPNYARNLIAAPHNVRGPELPADDSRSLSQLGSMLDVAFSDRSRSYKVVAELAERFSELRDELSEGAHEEATASHVRTNWAHYLNVAGDEERTVYITRDGKRYAALVPPHVAEAYHSETAWFHKAEWQEAVAEAESQYVAGKATVHLSDEEFEAALKAGDDA